ncbi:MAG: M15 family metallopeptidase [Acutalibacter sp.]|nr:M15 family metallopeptidase [Acutalibacter sp.]
MARKRKKVILERTDHLLDLSAAGRNLFVSRDKQIQSLQAKRIKLWMRVVMTLVILIVSAAGIALAAYYIIPWMRSEITIEPSPSDVSFASSEALPEYDSMGLPIYSEDVCLFVVNEKYPAEEDFVPELTTVGGVQVDSRIASALRFLVSAAKEDGLALTFTEGYVSYAEQAKRFQDVADKLANERGLTTVMAKTEAKSQEPQPGESDFQSGMCVRLDGDPKTFESSRTYSWLKANMGKYGFIFRYPAYKNDVTGVEADPTVIRYVGSASATAMQQRGLCLEEYISYLNSQ